jgi:methyl-accepting chemotaxis protein
MMSLSLKSKFRLLFAVILLGSGLAGWLVVGRLAVIYGDATFVSDTLMPMRAALFHVVAASTAYRLAETRHILSTNEQMMAAEDAALKASNDEIAATLDGYRRLLRPADDMSTLARLQSKWQDYVAGEDGVHTASHKNDNEEAFRLFRLSAPRFDAFQKDLYAVIDQTGDRLARARESSAQVYSDVVRSVVMSVAMVLMLAVVMAIYFERTITGAILRLRQRMSQIADGDLSVELPEAARPDEIGAMAATVQTFKDNASAMLRMEAEAKATRQQVEAQQAAAQAEREAVAARQAVVVEALAAGLERLATGDLTFNLPGPFAPEYERLRNDFNAAVEGLHHAIHNIAAHSGAIRTGTSEIAEATDDLAKRTEQQAASLEQTAAALDEITATVRHTATGSERAQSVAASAKADAEASGKVVGEAVAAMGEIEKSAREIGQIIGVIDEIAFQTNLLALNAGVEAARAGEAGRGFAVVASEVRALAQRAADAAKQIKTLISTSMQQVDRGVRLVGETGEALARIQAGVMEINTSVSEIASSAKEQATGLAEVNTAINQMDQVTQQNAAMVEQSTAAAHSLSHETDEMNQAVGRFRVKHDPTADDALRSRKRVGESR